MILEAFIKKWTGKQVDFDGIYPNQCFDLVHQYIYDVLEIKNRKIISHPAAYQIFTNFNQNSIDAKYFTKIENTPFGIPNKGDIMVWGQGLGKWGHTSIFISGGLLNFKSFDANYPIGSLPHIQKHNYKNVIGWLRPRKEQSMGQSPELKVCLVMHEKLVDENVKIKKENEELRAEYKAATEDFRREKSRLESEAKARNNEYKTFLANVAESIGSTQNVSQILAILFELVAKDEQAQKSIDELREKEVRWKKTRIELEGEILKYKQMLKAKDLSNYEIEQLLKAIIRKIIRIIKNR